MIGADRPPENGGAEGSPSAPTLIIGVGNPLRRDDGVGPRLIDVLREQLDPALATLVERSGEGATLMETWRGAAHVILIDAVRTGSAPGLIHRLDPRDRRIPSDFFHYSTHAFSVAEAVEMARVLGELPPRLLIFGIEGADFGAGPGLTAAVEAAVPEVAQAICNELAAAPAEGARSSVPRD